jgi:hypothetical protein
MPKRQGDNPTRRIAPADYLTPAQREALAARVAYVGSGHHKRYPADYGLERTNPRPTKSLCDLNRVILLDEARALLAAGVTHGMVSKFSEGGFPKFIWSVGVDGVYEAKTHPNTPGKYHGYPLEEDDAMRDVVKKVWTQRCNEN